MSKQPREWTDDIDDAVKGTKRNLNKGYGMTTSGEMHSGMHITSKGNVVCYDVACPIWQKDATKVTTTTVYHKPNSHEEKIKELERQQLMEDFKYNVAKNWAAVEKKVTKSLDAYNDEIIQVNRRIDQLHEKVGKGRPDLDVETFKAIVEKKLLEIDQKHHDVFEELDGENIRLRAQI